MITEQMFKRAWCQEGDDTILKSPEGLQARKAVGNVGCYKGDAVCPLMQQCQITSVPNARHGRLSGPQTKRTQLLLHQ